MRILITMPNRTIYIKNEDIEIWDKVFNPEWLHAVIQASKEQQ
jgi:hypothetical protein